MGYVLLFSKKERKYIFSVIFLRFLRMLLPLRSGLSSRHILAVLPNITTFNTSASLAGIILAYIGVTSAGIKFCLMASV